jgi:hypothetical protein
VKNLEEAVIDAVIEGVENTLKNIKKIRATYSKLDPTVKVEISHSETITQIQSSFPAELVTLLNFELDGDNIIIRPRNFLSSENFAKIASIVRNLGGEYISAGKESHFKIPKK